MKKAVVLVLVALLVIGSAVAISGPAQKLKATANTDYSLQPQLADGPSTKPGLEPVTKPRLEPVTKPRPEPVPEPRPEPVPEPRPPDGVPPGPPDGVPPGPPGEVRQ